MKHRWLLKSRISNTSQTPSGGPFGHARPPWAGLVLVMARALAHQRVGTREDPTELCVVGLRGLDGSAHIGEQLADLRFAIGKTPFWVVQLGIIGEKVEQAAFAGDRVATIDGLEIFKDDGLTLFVGHALPGDRHELTSLVATTTIG